MPLWQAIQDYQDGLRNTISWVLCYDSFLLHTSFISGLTLYPFTPFLWNAICLNAASLLHALHGSIILFPLFLYGHLFLLHALPQCSLISSIAQ